MTETEIQHRPRLPKPHALSWECECGWTPEGIRLLGDARTRSLLNYRKQTLDAVQSHAISAAMGATPEDGQTIAESGVLAAITPAPMCAHGVVPADKCSACNPTGVLGDLEAEESPLLAEIARAPIGGHLPPADPYGLLGLAQRLRASHDRVSVAVAEFDDVAEGITRRLAELAAMLNADPARTDPVTLGL